MRKDIGGAIRAILIMLFILLVMGIAGNDDRRTAMEVHKIPGVRNSTY
jgi:hypothetical protein